MKLMNQVCYQGSVAYLDDYFWGGAGKKSLSRKLSYIIDLIVQNLFTINTN